MIIRLMQKLQTWGRILALLLLQGNAGRPSYETTQEQVHGLQETLGFRWVDIAGMLGGMSTRTLSRHTFSSLSDEELDKKKLWFLYTY